MFYIGQTVNYLEEKKPAIYLGSEKSKGEILMWIYRQDDDKKGYDTVVCNADEVDSFSIPDKTTPTKTAMYRGANSRGTFSGCMSMKEAESQKDAFIKELIKAKKMFYKVQK